MRVVLLTTASTPGGVSRHLLDLATGLRARGHEPCLALTPEAIRIAAEAGERGVRVIPIRHAAREAADIWHLHLHDTYERESLLMTLKRRPSAAATVITEHLPRSNASDAHPPGRATSVGGGTAEDALQARADESSTADHRPQRRLAPVPPGAVWAHGSTASAGAERHRSLAATPLRHRLPRRTLRVISVGALGMQKGHDVLIEAAGLAREDWSVTIVGEGPGARPARTAGRSCLPR